MLRLLTDDNFNGRIVRGLRRRTVDLDLVRSQDVGLQGADDPVILEWASVERRVLLSHDYKTVPKYAIERVRSGRLMFGVIMVDAMLPIGPAIDDILLLTELCDLHELEGQIVYLPI